MGREKLSSQIAAQISSLINVELMPGEKIPTEEELCEKFDVSRTTIREAIKELCSINVLEIRRGVGTFVKENPGMVEDPFGWKYVDNTKFIPDMWETSLLLEPEIAALAARKATKDEVEQLKQIQEEFKKAAREYKSEPSDEGMKLLFELDGAFHEKIAEMAHNLILLSFYRSYVNIINIQLPSEYGTLVIDSNLFYHDLLIIDMENHYDQRARFHFYSHDMEVREISMGHPIPDKF